MSPRPFSERVYDVFIYADADPRTGISPEHPRYRFKHCVRASVKSAVSRETWSRSARLGRPFHEALIETNGHNISLVFSDLVVDRVEPGYSPYTVSV